MNLERWLAVAGVVVILVGLVIFMSRTDRMTGPPVWKRGYGLNQWRDPDQPSPTPPAAATKDSADWWKEGDGEDHGKRGSGRT